MRRALAALPGTVWLLGAISLLNDAASDMIYPLVPLYVASVLMAGPKALGWIEGVAEAASALLKLFAGTLADRLQRIKPFVVVGYGLAGVARPLIGVATSWFGVLVFRFVDRVGKGLRSAPRDALLAASVSPTQRGLAYGLHRGMDNAGAVVGPLVAAALLAAGFSLQQVFLFAIVPGVLVLLMALRLREPERTQAPRRVERVDWHWSALSPQYKRYLLALGLFTLGNASNMFLLLRAQELGLTASRITLLWATYSAVAALASTPLSALSDRIGRKRLILAGWAGYAAIYVLLGVVRIDAMWLWLAFPAYGLVTAACRLLTGGIGIAFRLGRRCRCFGRRIAARLRFGRLLRFGRFRSLLRLDLFRLRLLLSLQLRLLLQEVRMIVSAARIDFAEIVPNSVYLVRIRLVKYE